MKLDTIANSISDKKYWIFLTISFMVFLSSNIYLGILFEKTGYPVSLIEGQLRFNELLLKKDFSVLIDRGTLQEYRTIQYLDVTIMASTALFFGLLTLFIFKRIKNDYCRIIGLSLSLLFPLSGFMDFLENIWLLNMLENPVNFSGWKAIIYSGFALLKLTTFTIGLVGILIVYIISKLNIIPSQAYKTVLSEKINNSL